MKKLLLLGCVLYLVGCEKKTEAPVPPPPSKGPSGRASVDFAMMKDPAQDVVPAKPADFTLTATAYLAEYKKDANATKDKYKGKSLELSGTVRSFALNFTGDAQIVLDVPGDVGVSCVTRSKQPWDIAMPGQQVKIRGEFPEVVIFASLAKCDIVEVTGPKVPPLSAEVLGTAFDKDKDATVKQYDEKTLILTGTVAERQATDVGGVKLIFKTTSKEKVIANVPPIDVDQAKHVKVGDTVRFVGLFDPVLYGDGEVGIALCINAGPGK